jgi:hypothetical protein|tara:strand:+ start:330 stop:569 length:240 start_codon:yes stop_codon:yes gene_type:complete
MIEYFTALVIAYSVQDYNIETVAWFENERHCIEAMQSRSVDNFYNYIYDLYGNDISMRCEVSTTRSKIIRPKSRPEVIE